MFISILLAGWMERKKERKEESSEFVVRIEIEIVGREDRLVPVEQHVPVQTRRLEHPLRAAVGLRGAFQHPAN